jgi:hypothetical protein
LVLLLGVVSGCRGAHSANNRPTWINKANLEHPDLILVIGTCKGKPDADAARRCALADARDQLRSVYRVRGGLVRDEHAESHMGTISRGRQTILTVVHDAWILMAFPRGELRSQR